MQKLKEVEMLQNDGIFRAELLHRVNELCEIPKQLYILNSLLNKIINDGEDAPKEK